MMRGNLFGSPYEGFFDSPFGYDYEPESFGFEPNYRRQYDFNQPMGNMMPNLSHRYSSPVEIPVRHEGSSSENDEPSEVYRSRVAPEERRSPPRRNVGQQQQQPSPRCFQKQQSSKPYRVQQVPLNRMESPDVTDGDPYYSQDASPEEYESGFPFGGGFPFLRRSPERNPWSVPYRNTFSPQRNAPKVLNIPVKKVVPQKTEAKTGQKVINIPVEIETPQDTAVKVAADEGVKVKVVNATPQGSDAQEASKPTFNRQHSYKVRQVPIVLEEVKDETQQQYVPKVTKKVLTPMEQLANMEEEMKGIESRIENFAGEKTDKEYIILDENVTSLLLRLDMIESNGVEEIRNKRRQLVRHIQEYVRILERKVGIIGDVESTRTEEMEATDAGEENTEADEQEDAKTEMSTDELAVTQGDSEQSENVDASTENTASSGQTETVTSEHQTDISAGDCTEDKLSTGSS